MLYKLTDQKGKTQGWCQWGEGVTHRAKGKGKELCTNEVIHAYRSPLLAILLNPLHTQIENPILWEAKGRVVADDSLKVGCKQLTTIQKIELPKVTTEQKARFAILCALEVYKDEKFAEWAKAWLDGFDRSDTAAKAARTAEAAAWAAAAARAARAVKIDLAKVAEEAMKGG